MNRYFNPEGYNPYEQNLSAVKNYFKRPLVLVIAILYAVSLVISVISSVISAPTVANEILSEIYGYGDYYAYSANTASFASLIPGIVVTLIINGLIIAAALIIYFQSKNPNPSARPDAGFTINWILAILAMACSIFVTALCLFGGVIMIAMGGAYSDDPFSGFTFAGGVFFFAVALIFAAIIVFSIFKMIYWSSARKSAKGLRLSAKGAGAYGVLCIIAAALEILIYIGAFLFGNILIGYISQVNGAFYQSSFSTGLTAAQVLSLISGALSVVILFIDGIIALGYKKYVRQLGPANGFNGYNASGAEAPDGFIGYAYDPYEDQNPAEPARDVYSEPVDYSSSSYRNDGNNEYEQPPQKPTAVTTDAGMKMDVSTIDESENPFAEQVEQPVIRHNRGYSVDEDPAGYAQESRFCPHCGTPAEPDHIFCNKCGYKLR